MQSQGAINVSTLKNDHLKTKQLNNMELEKFIRKWNVGYEDKEQELEFSAEMKNDLTKIAEDYAIGFAEWIYENPLDLVAIAPTKELLQLYKEHLETNNNA